MNFLTPRARIAAIVLAQWISLRRVQRPLHRLGEIPCAIHLRGNRDHPEEQFFPPGTGTIPEQVGHMNLHSDKPDYRQNSDRWRCPGVAEQSFCAYNSRLEPHGPSLSARLPIVARSADDACARRAADRESYRRQQSRNLG
jgi:hypothetical protein